MKSQPRGKVSNNDRYVRQMLHLSYVGSVAALTGVQLVMPALPAIQKALQLNATQIGLFTSLYLLPGVLLAAPIGILTDRVGRRLVFCIAMALMGVGGIALFCIHNTALLFFIRLIQGVAFAALLPVTTTMIGDVVKGIEQVRAQAHRNIILELGDAMLPLIGAALVTVAWFAPFSVQALCLPLAVLGWKVIEEDRIMASAKHSFRELLGTLRTRVSVSIQVAGVVRFLLMFSIISYLPILLSDRGAGPVFIAIAIAIPAVSGMLAAVYTSRLIRKFRPSSLTAISLSVMSLALAAIAVVPGLSIVLVMTFIFGMGNVTYSILQTSIMVTYVDDLHRAGFVAVNGALRNFGKFLAPTLIGILLLAVSLSHAFIILAVAALFAVPTSFAFRVVDKELQDAGKAHGQSAR